MTIYVGNISYSAKYTDLVNLFAPFGTVKKVTIPQDHDKSRMKGYAFIDLDSESGEDKAVQNLQNSLFMGRTLKVERAHSTSTMRVEMPQQAMQMGE